MLPQQKVEVEKLQDESDATTVVFDDFFTSEAESPVEEIGPAKEEGVWEETG